MIASASPSGTDLSFLVAVGAGLVSFLSPCVLPLVPAYLAQLTAVAVAGRAPGSQPSRWLAFGNAAAYVAGFGVVFTLLGLTATFAGGPLVTVLPALRQVGGVVLIVMGLSLAGIVRIGLLDRVWRPLEAGAAASVAASTGTLSFATASPAGGSSSAPGALGGGGIGERLGGSLVSRRGGFAASFGLGAIFAVGWTPCIGIILGGILTMAVTSGSASQGAILLIGYTLGLGIPFLVLGLLYDRSPALLRPFVAHGRVVSLVGGLLVVLIGVAMLAGWLALLPRYFNFNTAI
ncbi:MAG TPA: cytochrome c biogenesis protein CcdA [Candidatus Saccharimonadales bacterium]|nr:cytochrome c biogenesis protein CcdA [Candidatus Saccharimonadales bacterium]